MVIRSSRSWQRLLRQGAFITFIVASLSVRGLETPKTLQEKLDAAAPGATVRLSPGSYEGNVIIHKPVRLVGAGPTTVLKAKSGSVVLVMSRDVELSQLAVWGETALETQNRAGLRLSQVVMRGSRAALSIAEGSRVTVANAQLEALDGARCTSVINIEKSSFDASQVRITGACRRSLTIDSGRLKLSRVSLQGALATALQIVDAEAELADVDAVSRGDEMAAVFSARSFVRANGLHVRGGLQGFLQRSGRADITRVRIEGSTGAGIALIGGTAEVKSAQLTGPFSQAAVFISDDAEVNLSQFVVEHGGVAGLLANRSDASVTAAKLSGFRFDAGGDFGHGIVGERARISVADVSIEDAQGAGIYMSQPPSSARVSNVRVNAVGAALVAVDGAGIAATALTGRANGAVAFAGNNASIDLTRTSVEAPLGTVECDGAVVRKGTEVTLKSQTTGLTCSAGEVDATWEKVMPRKR